MIDLHYDPIYVPGDIIQIEGYPDPGMVMSSIPASVISEILEGYLVRDYKVLFYTESDGFVFGLFEGAWLKGCSQKIGSLHGDFKDMVSSGTDVSEVLGENRSLIKRLNQALMVIDTLRNT